MVMPDHSLHSPSAHAGREWEFFSELPVSVRVMGYG